MAPPAPGDNAWTETVLYQFSGGLDSAFPVAGLSVDAAGALYGTAYRGGKWGCNGRCGMVFKVVP